MDKVIKTIMNKLLENGHEAYIVGGAVRDMLVVASPKDFDITTDAWPKEVMAIFKDYPLKLDGLQYGTVSIVIDSKTVEVTSYRKDGRYNDGRHPNNVTFTKDVIDDLKRRDFYINAILMDIDEKIHDPLNGLQDIKDKKIRVIGSPYKRFKEDALRILRAIRFSGQLGFAIDEDTKTAMYEMIPELDHIAKQRKANEFLKTLMTPCPNVLDEYRDIFSRFISYDLVPASLVKTDDVLLRLALLFIDHPQEIDKLFLSKKIAQKINTYMRYSNPKEEDLPTIFSEVDDVDQYIEYIHLYKGIDLRPYLTALRDYIVSFNTLAIKTSELIDLGYKTKALGDIKRQLVSLIHQKVIRNDIQDIMSYLLEEMV